MSPTFAKILSGISLTLLALPAQATPPAWTPPDLIDYGPKHDVLIRNDDGTLTPMDVPYYRARLIAPGTWQIESDGDYSYLIEGEDQALAIDTGYGAGNIRHYLQTLTKKPVRFVANTHFHFDHTALDGYFDAAYMSAQTAQKATTPFPSFAGLSFPRDYPKIIVKDGDVIHLGGRDIQVIVAGNHTPGGTFYLDAKQRILFSGDEVMPFGARLNVSVAQFAANMRKLEAHRQAFDRLAGGPGLFEASAVDNLLGAALAVLANRQGAVPSPRPAGPENRPVPGQTAPAGITVYQRRMVRAPDRPPGLGANSLDIRVMAYHGTEIFYDTRHIRD